MLGRTVRWWATVGGIAAGASISAGAIAIAQGSGDSQFSHGGNVSNRLIVPGNGGSSGNGNTGQTLLSLPGFGEFTVTECFFPSSVGPPGPQAQVTFTNTSQIPIETYSEVSILSPSGSPAGTLAPGQSEVMPSGVFPVMFAGGQGSGRRVATAELGDQTSSSSQPQACIFNIQATAQTAH